MHKANTWLWTGPEKGCKRRSTTDKQVSNQTMHKTTTWLCKWPDQWCIRPPPCAVQGQTNDAKGNHLIMYWAWQMMHKATTLRTWPYKWCTRPLTTDEQSPHQMMHKATTWLLTGSYKWCPWPLPNKWYSTYWGHLQMMKRVPINEVQGTHQTIKGSINYEEVPCWMQYRAKIG
jgi:hypothetical protein